jgi:ribosome biogenesis SPOUT family RNA methylase Rps3
MVNRNSNTHIHPLPTLKVRDFQVVQFQEHVPQEDGKVLVRQVILLYALAEDGNIYEFNGKWRPIPIEALVN